MLTLRPYKKSDAQHIVSWLKDEHAFHQWCADRYDHFPVSPDDINSFYDAAEKSGDFFTFTACDGSMIAGHLIMRFTDRGLGILRFGFIIVDDTIRGKGRGKEMLQLALRHAYTELGARRVTLGVFRNNPAARYCYIAAGFREINAAQPEYFSILGEEWECVEMEHTRRDFTV